MAQTPTSIALEARRIVAALSDFIPGTRGTAAKATAIVEKALSGRSSSPTARFLAARSATKRVLADRDAVLQWAIRADGCDAHLEEPSVDDDFFPKILCIHTREGQITWRLSPLQLEDWKHLETRPAHYDGCKGEKKAERLAALGGLKSSS